MTSRTAFETLETFARPLEAALACITQPHLSRDHRGIDVLLVLSLQQGTVRLTRTGHRAGLHFEFFLGYRIVHDQNIRTRGPFWVETEWWAYNIRDGNDRDLLICHWNPRDQQNSEPHLHVGSVLLDPAGHELGKSFSTLHIATGPVSIQQIVRMLIEEFDVEPLNADWDNILALLAGAERL